MNWPWASEVGDGWLPSFSDVSEVAGLLYPELIFCSEEVREGGLGRLGRGEDWALMLALLLGLLNALVSDERKADPPVGVWTSPDLVPSLAAACLVLLCRVSTARMWLWVSSRIFCASSCGSRGAPGGLSSCDFTVLSVSVLDWSDSPVSELLTFPTFWKGEFGLGTRLAFTGEVGVLTLPLEDTDAP